MNVKKECEIIIDDDPESGQCSDEETEKFKVQKKSKKHKKRGKGNKSRKRKLSESTSSSARTEIEFFNPYSVNIDRFNVKGEYYEPSCAADFAEENPETYSGPLNDDEDENFQCLDPINYPEPNVPEQLTNFDPVDHDNVRMNSIESEIKLNNLKALYYVDKTGIECTNADLRYYLLDFGFSTSLASDVFTVLYHTPSPEPEPVVANNEEEVEENEDEMFSDLPMIETSVNGHEDIYANSYSPEPANKIIEPYNTAKGLPVSYSSNFNNGSINSSMKPLNRIIDPASIPEVGPRDPRLHVVKQTHLKSQNLIPKNPPTPEEPVDKGLPKPAESNVLVNKEWEVVVANMVKTHLRLYLVHNDINKEEYKSILKRAVNKIISSGEKKLETDKISKFLHSYVIMMQKSRYIDSI